MFTEGKWTWPRSPSKQAAERGPRTRSAGRSKPFPFCLLAFKPLFLHIPLHCRVSTHLGHFSTGSRQQACLGAMTAEGQESCLPRLGCVFLGQDLRQLGNTWRACLDPTIGCQGIYSQSVSVSLWDSLSPSVQLMVGVG